MTGAQPFSFPLYLPDLCGLCDQKLRTFTKTHESWDTFPVHGGPCLRWFLTFFTGCADALVAYSRGRMRDRTETLTIGSRAPEFLLPAVNREGILSLSGFLSRGTLIVEFLRGTW